jgi:hypothetical protein
MKTVFLLMIVLFIFCNLAGAQTLYVDAQKGSDDASGTLSQPVASLQKATAMAAQLSGKVAITIKIAPGLYQLGHELKISSGEGRHDTAKYTLEALIMPDDKDWNPYAMPVIQSVSFNNDKKDFDHCVGLLVARDNFSIRGVKFTGNANPAVAYYYYYPIKKDSAIFTNLEISQCYFIGEKNGEPIQGGIYAEGPGLQVDHCIFYGCKNAVLIFEKTKDFSLTHCIIYGAYECAVWYGYKDPDEPFTFGDNIVSHCRYFWAGSKGINHSTYTFRHSLICENENYVGEQEGRGGVIPLKVKANYTATGVRKTGTVKLVEVKTEGLPQNYLNLGPESDGKDTGAGIFKIFK